jgi:hypothetical protein
LESPVLGMDDSRSLHNHMYVIRVVKFGLKPSTHGESRIDPGSLRVDD